MPLIGSRSVGDLAHCAIPIYDRAAQRAHVCLTINHTVLYCKAHCSRLGHAETRSPTCTSAIVREAKGHAYLSICIRHVQKETSGGFPVAWLVSVSFIHLLSFWLHQHLDVVMAEPLDRDTLFKKLRSKPENKVAAFCHAAPTSAGLRLCCKQAAQPRLSVRRSASTALPRTPPGRLCPMGCTSAWPVLASTAAWVCTSASSGTALLLLLKLHTVHARDLTSTHLLLHFSSLQVHHPGHLDRGAAAGEAVGVVSLLPDATPVTAQQL